jgi:hypothetical protein
MIRRSTASFAVCIVIVLLVISSSGQTSGPRSERAASLQRELIDLQRSFVTAKERGDADYVRNALADDFTSIEPNGSTGDRTDFLRDIAPSDQPGPPALLYDFKALELSEGTVVVTYCAVFPDERLDKYRHVSDAWTKQSDGWKLKFEQSTLNLWSAHDLD